MYSGTPMHLVHPGAPATLSVGTGRSGAAYGVPSLHQIVSPPPQLQVPQQAASHIIPGCPQTGVARRRQDWDERRKSQCRYYLDNFGLPNPNEAMTITSVEQLGRFCGDVMSAKPRGSVVGIHFDALRHSTSIPVVFVIFEQRMYIIIQLASECSVLSDSCPLRRVMEDAEVTKLMFDVRQRAALLHRVGVRLTGACDLQIMATHDISPNGDYWMSLENAFSRLFVVQDGGDLALLARSNRDAAQLANLATKRPLPGDVIRAGLAMVKYFLFAWSVMPEHRETGVRGAAARVEAAVSGTFDGSRDEDLKKRLPDKPLL